jgi:cytochrome b pre-mRNA-processing protein 3
LEEYVEEETGKTRKRVVRDENGQNKGIGEGWWFEGMFALQVLEAHTINYYYFNAEVGLPKTFNTWITVCFLHMWILQVRLRHFPAPMSKHWIELLTNHCFWEAEKTMDLVQKLTGSQRSKYLKDYFEIWRGTILAYDEGLVKGDAVLAAAVWRMLFDAKEDVDPVKIALVTAYLRKEVARVGLLGDKVLASGWVGFGEPVGEADILMQSPLMKLPFDTAVGRGVGSLPTETARAVPKLVQKSGSAAIEL